MSLGKELLRKAVGFHPSLGDLKKEASRQKLKDRSKMCKTELWNALLVVFEEQQKGIDTIRKNLASGQSDVSFMVCELLGFVSSLSEFYALAFTSRGAFQLAFHNADIKKSLEYLHIARSYRAYNKAWGRSNVNAVIHYQNPQWFHYDDDDDDDESSVNSSNLYDRLDRDTEYERLVRDANIGDLICGQHNIEVVVPYFESGVIHKKTEWDISQMFYNFLKREGVCHQDAYEDYMSNPDYDYEDYPEFPTYLLNEEQ